MVTPSVVGAQSGSARNELAGHEPRTHLRATELLHGRYMSVTLTSARRSRSALLCFYMASRVPRST